MVDLNKHIRLSRSLLLSTSYVFPAKEQILQYEKKLSKFKKDSCLLAPEFLGTFLSSVIPGTAYCLHMSNFFNITV